MAANHDPGAVVAVVLAAGAGRRFGRAKLLVPWAGRPLVRHVAGMALAAPVGQVMVVVGAAAGWVRWAVAGLPVRLVANPGWRRGQGSSIAAALAAIPASTRATVLLLADQPNVSADLVARCLELYRSSGAAVVMCHDGTRASPPTVFDASLFDELRRLRADEGGRAVVARRPHAVRHVPVAPWQVADVDRPLDYLKLALRTGARMGGVSP